MVLLKRLPQYGTEPAMLTCVTAFAHDPLGVLYLVQAATYAASAVAVRYGHRGVWMCYLVSAWVHLAAATIHAGLHP
jgi:hypothetical protein